MVCEYPLASLPDGTEVLSPGLIRRGFNTVMTRVWKKNPGFFVGGLLRGSKRSIAVLDFGGKVGDCASCVAACSDESFVGFKLILNWVFLPGRADVSC